MEGNVKLQDPSALPKKRAPDSYRIGDRVDPKKFRIFIEKITLESNHYSFVFQYIA